MSIIKVISMASMDEQILKTTKEIVVKFIEAGRVSPAGFDGRGNYSLGLKDQSIFPEIDSNNVVRNQGMDVTIVTSTSSDHEARELLRLMGMPFADK